MSEDEEESSELVVTLPCGGKVDLNKVPDDAETAVCTKGCTHPIDEVFDKSMDELEAGSRGLNGIAIAALPLVAGIVCMKLGVGEDSTFQFLGRTWNIPELLVVAGGLAFLAVLLLGKLRPRSDHARDSLPPPPPGSGPITPK